MIEFGSFILLLPLSDTNLDPNSHNSVFLARLVSTVREGVKYAARDDLALNCREPVFNLVEPGGIGWGIVDAEVGISCEKCRNLFGFMGAQVIGDDVDLAAWGLTGEDLVEELDKLGAGMPRASFPKHFTATGVQGSVKREAAMPVVLESITLGTYRGKRQHWIKPVKGLNGALFVYTEHRGVDGRLQIQPNNVGCLLFELRVVTGHIAPQPMGLNAVLPPDPINASRTNTQMFCQPVAAPMGSSIGRSLARRCQDFSLSLCRTYSPLTTPITRIQTAQPPLLKTFLQHTDIAISAVQAPKNLRKPLSFHDQKIHLLPLPTSTSYTPTHHPPHHY